MRAPVGDAVVREDVDMEKKDLRMGGWVGWCWGYVNVERIGRGWKVSSCIQRNGRHRRAEDMELGILGWVGGVILYVLFLSTVCLGGYRVSIGENYCGIRDA